MRKDVEFLTLDRFSQVVIFFLVTALQFHRSLTGEKKGSEIVTP
jgi:hypothetical protein